MGGMSQLETYTQRIRREGYEEGYEEGLEIGRREVDAKFVTRLARDKGMPFDKIADLLGLTVDEVRAYASRSEASPAS